MSDRTAITEPVTHGGAGPPTPVASAASEAAAAPAADVTPEAPGTPDAVAAIPAPRANGQAGRSPGVHAALSVMELVVTQGRLGLGDLARELQLPKSTLHRICAILVDRGWALRDERAATSPASGRSGSAAARPTCRSSPASATRSPTS